MRFPRMNQPLIAERRDTGMQNVPQGVAPTDIVRRDMGDGTMQITGQRRGPSTGLNPAVLAHIAAVLKGGGRAPAGRRQRPYDLDYGGPAAPPAAAGPAPGKPMLMPEGAPPAPPQLAPISGSLGGSLDPRLLFALQQMQGRRFG